MRCPQWTVGLAGRRAIVMAGLLCACVFCPARADEVYKSVDAQGQVTYSDRPNTRAAQKTAVEVQGPNAAEAARLAKEQAILKAEDEQRKRKEHVDSTVKEHLDHVKQVRCDNARNHYLNMKEAGRIFQRDADGNRVYYSDADADAKREEARKAMNAACGT
jgi:Domain of unknown function (DUF4124)